MCVRAANGLDVILPQPSGRLTTSIGAAVSQNFEIKRAWNGLSCYSQTGLCLLEQMQVA